jgi:hypothetical protein
VSTPTNTQIDAVLFEIGNNRHVAIVMTFDRAGSDFTVTRNGSWTQNGVTGPNYTVDYTCGTGSATPTICSRHRDVTSDLGTGTVLYLNQSKRIVLEQAPDNWVKCT